VTRENTPANRGEDDTQFDLSETATVPDPDVLFQALATTMRRRMLWYVLANAETTTDELADVLAGWESTTAGVVGPSEREEIRIELHHVHLPLLVAADLIEYDSEAETIEVAAMPEPVREIIRHARQYDDIVENTG